MSLIRNVPISYQLGKGKAVVLYIKAEWCPYCQRAKPEIERASAILGSAVPVYAVDADDNAALIKSWQARLGRITFPTILFSDGKGNVFVYPSGKPRTADALQAWVCKLSGLCSN